MSKTDWGQQSAGKTYSGAELQLWLSLSWQGSRDPVSSIFFFFCLTFFKA